MATNTETSRNLTGHQYFCLGRAISCSKMESIALGYLGVETERIKNLKEARRDDMEGFVRDIIQDWAYRNPDDQVQVRSATFIIVLSEHNFAES